MGAHVVTAGYVSVETAVPGGRATVDIPAGQVLPADVPAEQVASLLAAGRITPTMPTAPREAVAPASPAAPPRRGTGSGAAAWAEHAHALGVDIDADATRDQIIDAISAAGHPVD